MSQDDQVEVVIIKAKPKYPHQIFQEENLIGKTKQTPLKVPEAVPQKESQQPFLVEHEEEIRQTNARNA